MDNVIADVPGLYDCKARAAHLRHRWESESMSDVSLTLTNDYSCGANGQHHPQHPITTYNDGPVIDVDDNDNHLCWCFIIIGSAKYGRAMQPQGICIRQAPAE